MPSRSSVARRARRQSFHVRPAPGISCTPPSPARSTSKSTAARCCATSVSARTRGVSARPTIASSVTSCQTSTARPSFASPAGSRPTSSTGTVPSGAATASPSEAWARLEDVQSNRDRAWVRDISAALLRSPIMDADGQRRIACLGNWPWIDATGRSTAPRRSKRANSCSAPRAPVSATRTSLISPAGRSRSSTASSTRRWRPRPQASGSTAPS